MSFENLLLMRHELLLVIALVLVLIYEISLGDDEKEKVIPVALSLFGILTIVGFLPKAEGNLFGGMYHSTHLTDVVKNILNLGVFIVFLQSVKWLKSEHSRGKISEFYLLVISTLIGMDYMISSGDFLMFYLGLELASIPVGALVAFEKYKNSSAEAGIKFALTAAMSSGILLYGISMIYGTSGSIIFTEVAAKYGAQPLQVLAFIFFFAGMAFKISLVPFHLWTADVYEGAPMNVTSYLSVISKGSAAFVLTTILFTVFNSIAYLWKDLLFILAVMTITIGNLFAMRQKNIKRFLAFSSISQAGFILLGMISGLASGMTAIVYFILVYILSNLAAFGVASVLYDNTGKENISDYDGLYLTNPKLALVMTLALFSLAGIPPVGGYFSKFFLFTAAAQKQQFLLVFIALANTIISLYYYLLVVKAMFINKSENPIPFIKTDFTAKVALVICIAGLFVVGFASPIYEYIRALSFGM